MNDTLIVTFNSEDFAEPMLTIGRINHETEQIRVTAHYTGEQAVDIYNLLCCKTDKEVTE